MIYLASPYSHEDKAIEEQRYLEVTEMVADLFKAGGAVYSPITHCHEMAKLYTLPTDAAAWQTYNDAFIFVAVEVWFFKVDGWKTSKGMKAEYATARAAGKRCLWLEDDGNLFPMDPEEVSLWLR